MQVVKPDFINNLIASMVTLNRHETRNILEETLIHLSRFFHYNQKEMEYTTVSDECSFVEHYLFLQQLRYGSRLSFDITVGDSGSDYQIRPYRIFLTVEIIIERLVESSESSGLISISFNEEEPQKLTVSYKSDDYSIRIIV